MEALERVNANPSLEDWHHAFDEEVVAIREALAEQPASNPWVGLTDEERDYIWHTVGNSDAHGDVDGWSGRDVMAAIEAKLREKNERGLT